MTSDPTNVVDEVAYHVIEGSVFDEINPLDPPTRYPRVVEVENAGLTFTVVVATFPKVAGVPEVDVQYARFPAISAEDVAKYDFRSIVPAEVIVPPFRPFPAVIDVTVPRVVLHVAQATVMGDAPSTDPPAVTVITPDPERVVVGAV